MLRVAVQARDPLLLAVDRARKHFYASCAVVLGCWEVAAAARLAPTVTATVRNNPRLRPFVAVWLAGLAAHLLKKP